MNYIQYIVGLINDQIHSVFKVERSRMLGLAQAVRIEQTENQQGLVPRPKIVPCIYKGKGDVEYCGYDDNYSFTSYHKALNTNSTILPGGYGIEKNIQVTHNMALVIMANVDAVSMTPDQIALSLQLGFLGIKDTVAIPKKLIQRMTIKVGSINLNSEQVFREEFTNENYFTGPEVAMIKCLYSVDSVLNSRCYNKCEPINN